MAVYKHKPQLRVKRRKMSLLPVLNLLYGPFSWVWRLPDQNGRPLSLHLQQTDTKERSEEERITRCVYVFHRVLWDSYMCHCTVGALMCTLSIEEDVGYKTEKRGTDDERDDVKTTNKVKLKHRRPWKKYPTISNEGPHLADRKGWISLIFTLFTSSVWLQSGNRHDNCLIWGWNGKHFHCFSWKIFIVLK